MHGKEIVEIIKDQGIIAIMRAESSERLISAAEAIIEGGLSIIEVTMTTPGAIEIIKVATQKFGNDVLFGVGSVLDAETARAAILAGASFVVSPTLDLGTIEICKRYSVPVIPGSFTPTEIIQAWQAGADYVKVFPANFLGPSYLKAVKAPLPQVRLIPVGGVNLENAISFLENGADALGVGSALISNDLLEKGELQHISERAKKFRSAVNRWKLGD